MPSEFWEIKNNKKGAKKRLSSVSERENNDEINKLEYLSEALCSIEKVKPPVKGEELLPFEKITWKDFERLCVELADSLFNDARLYGKSGDKQYGIDIYCWEKTELISDSEDRSHKSEVFIQCKNVQTFSEQKLKSAIEEFERNKFSGNNCKLIICTNKIIGKTKLHDFYREEIKRLDKKGIDFILWDGIRLTKELKKQPQIVYDFFDRDKYAKWTKEICGEIALQDIIKAFSAFPAKQEGTPVKNYINRRVYSYNGADISINQYFSNHNETTLYDIIKTGEKRRIVLLSTAGAGKTAELQQLNYILSKNEEVLFPVYMPLGNYTGGELEKFIEINCADFKNYDKSKIVIILDGYDEISSDKLNDTIREINQLSTKYNNLRIVISSRSNFYKSRFEKFEVFYLNEIRENEMWDYAREVLGGKAELFKKAIKERHLQYLLSNAFNLVNLVEVFKETGYNHFPKNRAEAFEILFERKLKEDSEHYLLSGLDVLEHKDDIRSKVEILALSMEQLGKNVISEENFIQIINEKNNREVLKHTFLVNKNVPNNEWKFEHNNFQEYFAAKVLSNLDVNEIKKLISFEPDFVKIKPRWVNTVSLLFSILENTDNRYHELFNWIIEIEPEIIVKFERELLKPEQRFGILKAVFEYYKKRKILLRNESLEYKELSFFLDNYKPFIEYLLSEIESADESSHTANLISTLYFISDYQGCDNKVKDILKKIISTEQFETYVQIDAIECLLKMEDSGEEEINFIIDNSPNINTHRVRYPIYDYLKTSNFCDKYVKFLLEGLTIQKKEAERSSISDFSPAIITSLHKCESPASLKQIIDFIITHSDREHRTDEYYSYEDKKLMSEPFINNCIKAYSKEPLVYDWTIQLLIIYDRYFEKDKALVVRDFFFKTNTQIKAFEELIKDYNEQTIKLTFAFVIDEYCFNYIIDEYLREKFDDVFMRRVINTLSLNGLWELSKHLQKLFDEKTNGKQLWTKQHDWKEIRTKQHEQDLLLLQNKDSFLKEFEKFFALVHKTELYKEDLFKYDEDFTELSSSLTNSLVLKELRELTRNNNSVTIENVNQRFDSKEKWDWYVFSTIYNMLGNKEEKLEEWHINYLTNWALKKLEECDFKDSIWENENGGYSYWTKEHYVEYLWRKLNFPISESVILDFLYLDVSGIHEYQESGKGPRKTPADYVVERFPDREALKKRILSNIKEGIKVKNVLGTHFRLCKNLGITEAAKYIIASLLNGALDDSSKYGAIDIYLELGGKEENLFDVLDNLDKSQVWYYHLVTILLNKYPDKTINHIKKIFYNGVLINSENYFDYLKILISDGDKKALEILFDWIYENKKLPYVRTHLISFAKFQMEEINEKLFDLLIYSYNKDFDKHSFSECNESILEWIFQFGLSNGNAFKLVLKKFDEVIIQNQDHTPSVKNLAYSKQRFEKQYYLNKGDSISIEDVLKNNKRIFA